jgi:C4-dicarboxylate-binding protein DctP
MEMRYLLKIIVFVVSVSILGLGATAFAEEKYVFKGATATLTTWPLGWGGKYFKEQIEKMTDKIEVQWFPGGQLGGEVQLMNQLQTGVIQFATLSCAIMGNMNPKIMTMYTPYLIQSWDVFFNKWINSEGAKLIQNSLKKQGLIGMGWIPYGFNALCYTDPPIRTLEEAKGRKFRSAEAYTIKGTLEALGINAVPLPYTEVYQALQQKMVDGLTTPPASMLLGRFDEVCKNITLSNHLFGTHIFWVQEKAFNRLPSDLKDKFHKAVEAALSRAQKEQVTFDDDAVKKMQAKGIKAWQLSKSEHARWVKTTMRVLIEHEKRIDKASKDGRQFLRTVYKSLGRDYDKEVLGQ